MPLPNFCQVYNLELNEGSNSSRHQPLRSFSSKIKILQRRSFRMRALQRKSKPNPCVWKTLRNIKAGGGATLLHSHP